MDQQTLKQFDEDREYIISSLRKNPRNFVSTLYSEQKTGPFWNRKLETFSPYLSMNNSQLCCLIGNSSSKICLISTVSPLTHQGKEAETLLVKSGNIRQLQYYILKVFNLDRPDIRFFTRPISNLSKIGDNPQLSSCLHSNQNNESSSRYITNLQYIGCDNFTNEYLVGFVLDGVYRRKSGLQGIVKFMSATICNSGLKRKGAVIMEYADLGDIENFIKNPLTAEFRDTLTFTTQSGRHVQLNSLKSEVIVDICKQVVCNLDFLHREVAFNHGDFKVNNILINSSSSYGNYQGIIWNSIFTAKIADFGKSSLTITDNSGLNIRLFNYSSAAETYLSVFPFRPAIGFQFGQSYYLLDTITNLSALARIRHAGIPFYRSWDLYTFIISMLIIPEVFFPVMSTSLRIPLFELLFFQDDYLELFNRLYDAVLNRKRNSYDIILNILSGVKLKCAAIELLLGAFKNL